MKLQWREAGEDRYQADAGDASAVVYRTDEGLWYCVVTDVEAKECVYSGEEGYRMRSGAMNEAADVVRDLGMA